MHGLGTEGRRPMGRNDHADVFAVRGHYFLGRHPVISAVGCDTGDCRVYLIQQRCNLRRVSDIVPSEGRSHDHSAVGIHSQVSLFPSASRFCAMLLLKLITGSEDFQPRAVDQQVDRPIRQNTAFED